MVDGREMPKAGAPQSARTRELLEKRERFVARGVASQAPIFVERARGAVVEDLDGNRYLDLYAGIGVINAGHCPPPVVEAIREQSERLLHSCFMVSMYEPYVALAERLVALAPGDGPKKAMFVNSGAEAVENAVKIARASTGRPGVIAFEAGYHGRTLLTMTLTSKVKPYKHQFGPFAPEVYKVPSAYCYRCAFRSTYPTCGMHCLEHIERFFVAEADPSSIAAMVIEPVQGEGGFIVPPPEFLPGLKSICEKHDIVFVADEVQTGFGRTGAMFAVERFQVVPDLMAVAKSIAAGLPLAGVVGDAEIMDAPTAGRLGGTFGGNPVACAAALATLASMEQDALCARAERIGEMFTRKMRSLQERLPGIGDVRSLGAMVAVELVTDRRTKAPDKDAVTAIVRECRARGLLVLGAGIYGNVLRFLPPLVITDAQLDEALSILGEVMEAVLKRA
jgi:4-aminobutyrate aminotransferase/(S)-3-amino-2-methylpropionate transaminase